MFTAVLLLAGSAAALHPLSDEFIAEVNQNASTWRAGRTFPVDTPLSFIRSPGAPPAPWPPWPGWCKQTFNEPVPENFDPRDKWSHCTSMNDIATQGDCASGWAIATCGMASDRICIQTYQNVKFSAYDMMSCTGVQGCYEGSIYFGLSWMHRYGIVSGGGYNSSEGCRPYPVPPCEGSPFQNSTDCQDYTTECKQYCQEGYNKTYEEDLRRNGLVYCVNTPDSDWKENRHWIQDLWHHGPFAVLMDVYEDFLTYKSGVYFHNTGKFLGTQHVKIMGWGIENNVRYWLAANSWGTEWGEKGFFKILRGSNECNLERQLVWTTLFE